MHRRGAVLPVQIESKPQHAVDVLDFCESPVDISVASTTTLEEMKEFLNVLDEPEEKACAQEAERAEKRRKHREAMVLFRLRKKSTFEDMKKQEHKLQDVLQAKLQQHRQHNHHSHESGKVSSSSPSQAADGSMRTLVDEFADVVAVKESLLRENRAIEGVIHEMTKFQRIAQDETERVAEEEDAMRSTTGNRAIAPGTLDQNDASGGYWVNFVETEAPFYYDPVPEETCNQMTRDSFTRLQRLRSGFISKTFDVTETYCLGWRAQRSLGWTSNNDRVMRFRFTRLVPRSFRTLDQLQHASWNIVSVPEMNTRVYSSRVVMKVVQSPDENTFISIRNSPHKDRGIHWRYFAFNARLEYADEQSNRSVIIVSTIMDKRAMMQSADASTRGDQPVVWIKDGALCLNFSERPDKDAVEVEYCGFMQCVNEEQAQYLMVETCNILMRWEHIVVPPRLLTLD